MLKQKFFKSLCLSMVSVIISLVAVSGGSANASNLGLISTGTEINLDQPTIGKNMFGKPIVIQPNATDPGNDGGGSGYSSYKIDANGTIHSVDALYALEPYPSDAILKKGTRIYFPDKVIQMMDVDYGQIVSLSGWAAFALAATKYAKWVKVTPLGTGIAMVISTQLYNIKRMNIVNGSQGVTLFWNGTEGMLTPKILSGYQPFGY